MRSVKAEVSPVRACPGILVNSPGGDVLRRLGVRGDSANAAIGRVTVVESGCTGEEFGIERGMCYRLLDGDFSLFDDYIGAFFFQEPTSATVLTLAICETLEGSSFSKLHISGTTLGGVEVVSFELPMDAVLDDLTLALVENLLWPAVSLLPPEDEFTSLWPECLYGHTSLKEHKVLLAKRGDRECLACKFDALCEAHMNVCQCGGASRNGLSSHHFCELYSL